MTNSDKRLPTDDPIVTLNTNDFLICKVVDKDDYRLACWVSGEEKGAVWRTRAGDDVSFSLDELREIHNLIGRVLDGEPMIPYEDDQ